MNNLNKVNQKIEEPKWLMIFADLLALMLTFFILLYSMKTIPVTKWDKLLKTFHAQFQLPYSATSIKPQDKKSINIRELEQGFDLDYLETLILNLRDKHNHFSEIKLSKSNENITISLPSDALFKSGEAQLQENARQYIIDLGYLLVNTANQIDVIGHTDSMLMSNEQFASNWELSLARAMSVNDLFINSVGINNSYAYGVADSHINEIDQSLPQDEINRLSRRVDIVVREIESDATLN